MKHSIDVLICIEDKGGSLSVHSRRACHLRQPLACKAENETEKTS